jgi:hypothetical protein
MGERRLAHPPFSREDTYYMIINVKNNKDVITFDFQLGQIRYCRNIANHGKIEYLSQFSTTMDCYKYLYDNNRTRFFECVAEDVGNDVRKQINPERLKILTDQEYVALFA